MQIFSYTNSFEIDSSLQYLSMTALSKQLFLVISLKSVFFRNYLEDTTLLELLERNFFKYIMHLCIIPKLFSNVPHWIHRPHATKKFMLRILMAHSSLEAMSILQKNQYRIPNTDIEWEKLLY